MTKIDVNIETLMFGFQFCLRKYQNTPSILFKDIWDNRHKLQSEQLDCFIRMIDKKNKVRCKNQIAKYNCFAQYKKDTAPVVISAGNDIYWIQFRELMADEQKGMII
jgi:hypothetical protein